MHRKPPPFLEIGTRSVVAVSDHAARKRPDAGIVINGDRRSTAANRCGPAAATAAPANALPIDRKVRPGGCFLNRRTWGVVGARALGTPLDTFYPVRARLTRSGQKSFLRRTGQRWSQATPDWPASCSRASTGTPARVGASLIPMPSPVGSTSELRPRHASVRSAAGAILLRSCDRIRNSSRDTCICDTPICSAICAWVRSR